MAAGTIDSELFFLSSKWPQGQSKSFHYTKPTDGFTSSDHHNVETAAFDVGTQILVRNHNTEAGIDGNSMFIYLQAADAIAAAKEICVPAHATIPTKVSSTKASALQANDVSGTVAISISAMTDEYFGWFWCDGVCPEEYVSALGGTYICDAVTTGPLMAMTGPNALEILGPLAAVTDVACGYATTAGTND